MTEASQLLIVIAMCVTLSALASPALVSLGRSIALSRGLVDHPDRDRKLHETPVALGGGIAVFAAFVLSFALTNFLDHYVFGELIGYIAWKWYVLFFAAGAIMIIGFVDDVYALRGTTKLLLQCVIIAVLIACGTEFTKIGLLGYEFQLGPLSGPATFLWLLLAVNALNLIDGADGMATVAGLVICVGLGVLCLFGGNNIGAVLGFGMAGTLAGFLVFNHPPATIYLGDAGSMMIGLFVGVLAVWSSFKQQTILASAPVAILAIPLFDSTAAIVRRWLTGRSIYTADRAHLHHVLQVKYGPIGMLWVVAGLCTTTMSFAVASRLFREDWIAVVGVAIVIGWLIFTRSFGHAESRLVIARATHLAQSLTRHSSQAHRQRQVPLQGDGPWETIWEPLVGFANNNQISKLKINLSMAWLHEGYHASWEAARSPERTSLMSVCVPLFATRGDSPVQIGTLDLGMMASDSMVYEKLADLSDFLCDLDPEIHRIVSDLESRQRPALTESIENAETVVEEEVEAEVAPERAAQV